MPLTDSLTTVAKYVENLLVTSSTSLGLDDVFYGDQVRIPRTPAACVEPGEKRRQLNGAPRRTQVDFTIYVIVYHYNLKSVQDIREDNDLVAEAIETVIHSNSTLGGNVIHSMVSGIESGYQAKGNSLFRASRITIEARSQMQLPFAN